MALYGGTATHDGNGVVTLNLDSVAYELGEAIASAQICLYRTVDVEGVWRYYKLQASTLAKPSVPTTNPPSGWTDTEPTYTSGSTNSLYFTDLTLLSDGTWSYSPVSLSSSYEAAKQAYNKAVAAGNAAQNAQDDIDNLEVGGRNIALETGKSVTITGTNILNQCQDIYFTSLDFIDVIGENISISFDYEYSEDTDVSTLERANIRVSATPFLIFADFKPTTDALSGHYENTVIIDASQESCSKISARFDYFNGSVTISNLKLEKGNKPTDWTPAPEDMATSEEFNNSVEDTNNRFNDIAGSMDELGGEVSNQATILAENVTRTSELVNEQGAIKVQVEETKTTLKQVGEQVEAEISERQKYIDFSTGDILLGASDSKTQLNISHSQIDFLEDGEPVAWISGKKEYITEVEITKTLTLGAFEFTIHGPNNNLGIRRITG